jgi:hypothetical protein
MWNQINNAESVDDLKLALYTVCCRLQELEDIVVKQKLTWKATSCQHEWVSADNEVVTGGEICIKCHKLRTKENGKDK